jgi:hypothetical protein
VGCIHRQPTFFVLFVLRPFRLDTESIRVEEELWRLLIDLSKLNEFKDFDTALARLAFREERVRPFHACGDFALCQTRFLAGRDEFFEESVVESLMGRRPPLARDSSLRLLLFLHPSSVGNA